MVKKVLIVVVVIFAALAVGLPFVPRNPDGLQNLIASSGKEQQSTGWSGLMAEYSVAVVSDPYVSTLLAGVLGVLMVLALGFGLGKAASPKKKKNAVE